MKVFNNYVTSLGSAFSVNGQRVHAGHQTAFGTLPDTVGHDRTMNHNAHALHPLPFIDVPVRFSAAQCA